MINLRVNKQRIHVNFSFPAQETYFVFYKDSNKYSTIREPEIQNLGVHRE